MRWGAVLLLLAGCTGGAPVGGRVVPVARQDLIVDIEVTGALKAVRSEQVTPPSIADTWEFKIIRMAPEGSRVKVGDEVLAFDASDLERKLKDYETEVAAASQELAKLRAEGGLATLVDRLAQDEARAKDRKAQLKAGKPADITGEVAAREAVIDRQLAHDEVSFTLERDKAKRKQERADQAVLQTRLDRAQARVKDTRAAIAQMSVKARRAGTVVHRQDWKGEKRKIGDGTWKGDSILEIASLDEMSALGQIDEVDASRVTVGQKVGLRLEAHPEHEYGGVVQRVASLVQTESPESRVRVVQLDIHLESTDPMLMRPGMRFRGRIEVSRSAQVLQMPLAAVRVGGAGPVALRLEGSGPRPVPVKLGRRSREAIEVLGGLREGDRVVVQAASKPGKDMPMGGT
jgi:HlyD family secretion protein